MTTPRTTFALLLLTAAVSAAHAQDRGVDANNITTRSNITGSITQSAAQVTIGNAATRQSIGIGGVTGRVDANNITATGNVFGTVNQTTAGRAGSRSTSARSTARWTRATCGWTARWSAT
jgi:hypothetical protein